MSLYDNTQESLSSTDGDFDNSYDNTTWDVLALRFLCPPCGTKTEMGGVSGNVTYVDRNAAIGRRLTHINDVGNAVLMTTQRL